MNDLEKLSEAVNLLRSNVLCPICLEPLQNAVSTRCNHHFCSDCYNKLITINRTAYCPMCHCKVNRRTVLKDAMLDRTVQAVRDLLKSIEQDSGIDFAEALPLPRSTREAVCGGSSSSQSKQTSSVPVSHLEVPVSKPSKPKQAISALHTEEIPVSHQEVQQENIDTAKISEDELHLSSENVPETSPKQSKCDLITIEDSENIPSNTIESETKDKNAKNNSDGWLKRYKKQYSGRAPPIQLDESILFPAELIHPPPKVKKRPRADLDVSKVTTNAKVQNWLELYEDNLEECENMSILNGALPRRITVEADVHNSPSDEDELLSVSQLPPKDTIIHVPRAVNYAILPGVDEIETLEPTPSEKIPETREPEVSELVKPKGVSEVKEVGKLIETDNVDPYEFISSQKSQNNIKQKRKHTRKKYSKKSKEPLWKDISMYIKETYSNKRSKQDAKVTEASFVAPVSINDTFDNLLAEYRKNLTDEVCGDSLPNTKNVPVNDPNTGNDVKNELVPKNEDELNNATVYKSQTDPVVDWNATPETFDLSSGSDEEWMETRKKTRKTQRQSKPFKVFDPPSRLSSRRQSKQLSTSKQKEKNGDVRANKRQSRQSFTLKRKVEEENDVLESIKGLFKEIDDHNLLTSSQVEREALAVANDSVPNEATPDINLKDSHQVKDVNTDIPNTCNKEQDHPSDDLGRKSSPGWSHLTQLKKDFKGSKKPTLKALDVSKGSSSSKKNVSFTVPNNENQITEVETPVVIDDGSIVGIGSVNEINNTSEKIILMRNPEEQDKSENAHLPGGTREELINNKTCESPVDKNGHIPVAETQVVITSQKEASPEPQTFITSTIFETEKQPHRRTSFNQDLVLSDSRTLGDPVVAEGVQERSCNDVVQTAVDNSTADTTEVVPSVLDKQECTTAEFTVHGLENPCETEPLVYVNSVRRDRTASDLSTSSCELVGYSEEPNTVCKIGVMKDIISTLEHEIINEEESIRKRSQVNHILPCNLQSQLIVPESESASSEERTCEREKESKFTNNSELQSQQTGNFEIVQDSLDIGMNADETCKTPALVLRGDYRTIRMQPEESTDTSAKQPLVCFYKLGTIRPLHRTFIAQFIYRGSLAPKRKRKVSRTNNTGILSQKDDDSQEIPFITWEQNEEEEPILKKRCLYSAHEVHLKRRSLVAAKENQKHSHKEVSIQTSQKYSEQSVVVQTCQKVPSPQTFSLQTSHKSHSLENEVKASQKTSTLADISVQTSQDICSVDVEIQTSQQTHSHCVANVQTSPSIGKVPTLDCEVQVSSSHRNVQAQTSPVLFKIPAEPSVQPQKQAMEVQTTQSLHRVLDGRNKECPLEEGQISPSFLDQPFEDMPLAEECAKPLSHTDGAKECNLQSGSNTDSEFQLAEVALDKNLDLDSSHKKNESVEIIYDQEKHKVNRQLNFKEACMSPAKSITGNSDAQNCKSLKNFKRIRHMSSSESGDEVEIGKLMVTKKGKTKGERPLGVKPLINEIIGLKSDSEPDVVSSENFIPGTYESPRKVQTEEEEEVECLNSEELLQKIMDNIDEDIGILEKKTSQNEKRKSIPKSVCGSDIDSEKKIDPSKDKRIVSPAQNFEPTTADMFSLTRKESERVISQVQSTGVETKTDDIFSDTERESERIISQPQNFEVRTADMFCSTGREPAGNILQAQSIEHKIADMFSRSKKEPENSPLRKMKRNKDVQKPAPNESVILEESMSDSSDVVEATPKKTEASSVRARSSNSGGRESLQHAIPSITTPKTKPTNRAVHSEVAELPQVIKHPDISPQKKSSNKIAVLMSSENSPKPADRIVSPRRSTRCSPRKSSTVSTPGKNVVASSKSVQQPVFVCSGLTPPLITKVKAAAKMLGAKFSDVFVFDMSHLIVKVDENNAAEKTLKYLQAVASGKWVVSYAWIVACMEAKRLLPEDDYEAVDSMGFDGPRRSRTRTAPLFNNFQFCCIPPFSIITVDKLQEILTLCGGIVVTSPRDFRRKANTFLICVVETESTASEETYGRWLDQYGVVSVGSDWVLDCIGSYCIFSLWPYLMFNVSRERLQALGYSEEMLLSEDENEDDVSAAV